MNNRQSIPWGRILAEGAAIVVSILLAFAIDAWWDNRKERFEEHQILLGLEAEFSDLRDRLDQWAQFNQEGGEAIEQLLNAPADTLEKTFIERVFDYGFAVNVLDQGGPLDALLSSGRLERIEDQEIRMRLAKWPDWLEDIHTNDISLRTWAWSELLPYINRNGYPNHMCEDRFIFCSQPGPVPPQYLQMLADPEFRAILMTRRAGMLIIAGDHADARGEADAILELFRNRMDELEQMLGL